MREEFFGARPAVAGVADELLAHRDDLEGEQLLVISVREQPVPRAANCTPDFWAAWGRSGMERAEATTGGVRGGLAFYFIILYLDSKMRVIVGSVTA